MKKMHGLKDLSQNSNSSDDYIKSIKSSQKRLKLQGITEPFQTHSRKDEKSRDKIKSPINKFRSDRINKRTRSSWKSIIFQDPYDNDSSDEELFFNKFENIDNRHNKVTLTPANILDFENTKSRKRERSNSSDDFIQMLNKNKLERDYKKDIKVDLNCKRPVLSVLEKLRKKQREDKENIRIQKLISLENRQKTVNCKNNYPKVSQNLKQSIPNSSINNNVFSLKKIPFSTRKYKDDLNKINTQAHNFETISNYLHSNNLSSQNLQKNREMNINGNSFDKQMGAMELRNRNINENNETCSQNSQVSQYFKMKNTINDNTAKNTKLFASDTLDLEISNYVSVDNRQAKSIRELQKSTKEEMGNNKLLKRNKIFLSIEDNFPLPRSQKYINEKASQDISASPVIGSNRKVSLKNLKHTEASIEFEDMLENNNIKMQSPKKSQLDQEIDLLLSHSSQYLPSKHSKNKHKNFTLDDFLQQISEPKTICKNNISKPTREFNNSEESDSQQSIGTKFEIILESSLDQSINSQSQGNTFTQSVVNLSDCSIKNNHGNNGKSNNVSNLIIKDKTRWVAENNISSYTESITGEAYDTTHANKSIGLHENTFHIGEVNKSLDSTHVDESIHNINQNDSQDMSSIDDLNQNILNQVFQNGNENLKCSIQKRLEQHVKDIEGISQGSRNTNIFASDALDLKISNYLSGDNTQPKSIRELQKSAKEKMGNNKLLEGFPLPHSQKYTNEKVSQDISASPVIGSNRKVLLKNLKHSEARIEFENMLENNNIKVQSPKKSQLDREIDLLLSHSSQYLPSKHSKNKHSNYTLDDFFKQISEPKTNYKNNISKRTREFNDSEESDSQQSIGTKFEIILESSLDQSINSQSADNKFIQSIVNQSDSSINNILGNNSKSISNLVIKDRTQEVAQNSILSINESITSEARNTTHLNKSTGILENTVHIGEVNKSLDLTHFDESIDNISQNDSQDMSIIDNQEQNVSNQVFQNLNENLKCSIQERLEQNVKDTDKDIVKVLSQGSKNELEIETFENENLNDSHLIRNTSFENNLSQDLFDESPMVLNQSILCTKLCKKCTVCLPRKTMKFASLKKNLPKPRKIKSKPKNGRAKRIANKIKTKSVDQCIQTDEFEICSNFSQSFSQNTYNSIQNYNDTILTVPEDNGVVILNIPEIFQITNECQMEKEITGEGNSKNNKGRKRKQNSQSSHLTSTTDLDCSIDTSIKNRIPEKNDNLKVFESVPNFVQSSKDIVISHRFIETSVVLTQAFNSTQEFVRHTNTNTQNVENNEDLDNFVNTQLSQPEKIIVTGENKLVTDDNKKVPKSLNKLRKSIDNISRDLNLICPIQQFEILSHEQVKVRILSKIAKVFCEMNEQVINNKKIVIHRKDVSWGNAGYENGRLVLKSKTCSVSDNPHSALKMVVYLLRKVYNLLTMNSSINKREIYYQIINYAKSQWQVDRGIHIVSLILNHGQWDFGILTTSKGLAYGKLKTITFDDECVHFNKSGGTLIPNKLTNIKKVESQAYFILIVEKDAIFQKLLDEDAHSRLGRPFILITGKGFPDTNTRYFVNMLWKLLQIPIFILVDADPYGIEIMMTYRFGSLNMAHIANELALPSAKWIGVHPSEIESLNLERKCLSTSDVAKVKRLLKRPYCDQNPEIKKELETMLSNKYKAEIESLIKCNKFLSNFYLPNKLLTKDFI